MRWLVVAVCALALVPAAAAGTTSAPVYDDRGNLVETPFAPDADARKLTEDSAVEALFAHPKVAAWLDRYPPNPETNAEFDDETRLWTVKVWSGDAGQVALGKVDDASGSVTEAWTGPQVAWKMARGYPAAFGGRTINRPLVWLSLCAIFLLGLADWRRVLSLRNLDLLVLLSFTVSLWFFNRGDVFTSVPLAYPPLVYLAARHPRIGGRRRRAPTVRPCERAPRS